MAPPDPYFTVPFTLDQGWESVLRSTLEYQFHNLCWNKEPNTILTRAQLIPYIPDLDDTAPNTPGTFQTFPAPITESLENALLRQEYIHLYEWLCDFDFQGSPRRQANVITGHPGIGKTIFRIFILYKRCLAGKPTLYLDSLEHRLFLFYEGGVASISSTAITRSSIERFQKDTWLLIDGAMKEVNPLTLTLPKKNHPRIIFTTSPFCESIWKMWEQVNIAVIIAYMKGWTDDEFRYGCALHKVTWDTFSARRHDIGPIPRYLFEDIEARVQARVASVDRAVESLSNEQLRRILMDQALSPTTEAPDFPYHILFMNRVDSNPLAPPVNSLLSERVGTALRRRLLKMGRTERASLIRSLSGSGFSRSIANIIYEMYILDTLTGDNFSHWVNMFKMVHDLNPGTASDQDLSSQVEGRGSSDASSGGSGWGSNKRKMKAVDEANDVPAQKKPCYPVPRWHTAYGSRSLRVPRQEARSKSAESPSAVRMKMMEQVTYEPGERLHVKPDTLYPANPLRNGAGCLLP